jgi:tetratricopeptide (TPR) repeat protein
MVGMFISLTVKNLNWKNKVRTRLYTKIILILACVLGNATAFAQTDPLTQARNYIAIKAYEKAADVYKGLYKQNPNDKSVYSEYFSVLLEIKEYKKAGSLVEEQMKNRQYDPLLIIDMGRIFMAQGKTKRADTLFAQALQYLTGDDLVTQLVANSFIAIGREDYAVKTYERMRDMLHNPSVYSGPLARLYAQTGQLDKAILALLEGNVSYNGVEEVKSNLLELLGTDGKKQIIAQRTIIKKLNEQPENPYFTDLLTWLYTQKNDWEGAMLQMEALDMRHKEQGERIIDFARYAAKEGKYPFALKAYDVVIDKGKDLPYYGIAKAEKLGVRFKLLQENPAYKKEDAIALGKEYGSFLEEYPVHYSMPTIRDYATLEAQYAGNVPHAIALLEKALAEPGIRREFKGVTKLHLGDYLLLMGKIWDASLTYSQVDKDFREDMLGEDARFRNAKLAYYRGDFAWAEGQLSVLKASTSELIANDALYLSVLITENITPDSNYVPLRRFAYADLLMFQNKDTDAEVLYDSVSKAFPEHPLKDDIFMQRAKLSIKHRDYNKALDYLKEIYINHGKDVLGDDAVFKTADIYEKHLKQPDKAKHFYEQLITDYPGSTYIQTARTHIANMQAVPASFP